MSKTTNTAKDLLDNLTFALGITGSLDKKSIKAFLKGTPEEVEAAQEIVNDMVAKAEGIEAGTVTSEDLDAARDAWKKTARMLLEAKRLRVEKNVIDVFLDVVTLYLRRLLPAGE